MGPSGSGKTTLLNVLAGQLSSSPRSTKFFLQWQDCVCETGGSALLAHSQLFLSQLPEISSAEEKDEDVNNLLFKLGLVSCADSCVGDAKVRAISGGEKKRLSLGILVFFTGCYCFQAGNKRSLRRSVFKQNNSISFNSKP
ncbi:unnamed protein product [Microthlaspi erraticum]|uniref:ABC transporter domain-containing protein n=1 Tax=Microthlaspi erraticum TaxID=1685480 RepID=A0A6D2HIK2_9BRAS|nr:unnamed protein product [Microthlaspi erraticum]